ncbi:hypothetical protein D0817_13700 [Flavobacterium cupreum]|uniref:Uncharacterized protein n=1 Tax=Flavobacterium cupreum TaxID=2133766 RepID=A0A434A5Q8_9FLAO|nr:hypothetical protein D0817_13700 [Flavobacterium cupreum]
MGRGKKVLTQIEQIWQIISNLWNLYNLWQKKFVKIRVIRVIRGKKISALKPETKKTSNLKQKNICYIKAKFQI